MLALAIGLSAPAFAQSTASPHTFATRYDEVGRVKGTIAPDPDGAGPLKFPATRNAYNDQGWLIRADTGELSTWQDENVSPGNWGNAFDRLSYVRYQYDEVGRKINERHFSKNDTLVARTDYSYDAAGRLECTARRMNLSATPPDNACMLGTEGSDGPDRITKNVYDAAGQVVTVVRGHGTTLRQDYVQYTYDDNGNKLTVTDANGYTAKYEYDGYDRLIYWYFPSKDTPGQHSTTDYERYAYDANGNLTKKWNRHGELIEYAYDTLNRMTMKDLPNPTRTLPARYRRDVYYGYDLQGLQLYARYGGSAATDDGLTTTYDAFGRMTSNSMLMDGVTRTLTYEHNNNGVRTRITHPDGNYFTYEPDGLDRIVGIYKSDDKTLRTITYDNRGNPEEWRANADNVITDLSYDDAGRLTGLAHDLYNASEDVAWTYGYNPAGQTILETRDNDLYRWTGFANDTIAYEVNGLNQYTSVDGNDFTYDAAGNLTDDGETLYLYDIENRLVEATGSKDVELTYDPMGRLYEVKDVANNKVTRFLWDGDELVMEFDGSGTILRRHIHGAGVDDPIVTYFEPYPYYDNLHYLVTDRQGSVVALSDKNGRLDAINAYDEYGVPISNVSGEDVAGRFGYTGQAWIPELGLWHYKARFYSPTLGRFMQTDPIGYEDQVNLYAYVGNDPVNMIDPTGMYECKGNDEQCAAVSDALIVINDAIGGGNLTNEEIADLQEIVDFYGEEGEENGVNLVFLDQKGMNKLSPQGRPAVTDFEKGNPENVFIIIHESFGNMYEDYQNETGPAMGHDMTGFSARDARAGLIAHEGRHGVDIRAAGGFTPNPEPSARRSQQAVHKGLGSSSVSDVQKRKKR